MAALWCMGAAFIHAPSGSAWDDSLAALVHGSASVFAAEARPFLNATLLSYVVPAGSYHQPSMANATVMGWRRVGMVDPTGGGMRALAFVEDGGRRGIVAFRGTDLGRDRKSAAADACADAKLWPTLGSPPPKGGVPNACAGVAPQARADYLEAALNFARAMAAAHPGVDWAFTGHSLGAGLAVACCAALGAGARAVPIASPPTVDLVHRRFGGGSAAGLGPRVVHLANALDPVHHEAAGLKGLPGTPCIWPARPGAAAASCHACFRDHPAVLPATAACAACFAAEHIFSNYFYTLAPGPRPICSGMVPGPAFPAPTFAAARGRTPAVDGKLAEGEWDDAASLLQVAPQPTVQEFRTVTNGTDWSLRRALVKFDKKRLYLGLEVVDDLAYGVDTPSWQPAGNPDARLLNRTGWPWFGDEVELLLDARPRPTAAVAGTALSWQLVCSTIKSQRGGYGTPGVSGGEPRANATAWAEYMAWIAAGRVDCASSPLPAGGPRGYALEWAVDWALLGAAAGSSDRSVRINLAFGDVDTPEVGDSRFGLRHETWFAGTPKGRTHPTEFGTLWLLDPS